MHRRIIRKLAKDSVGKKQLMGESAFGAYGRKMVTNLACKEGL